MTEMSSGSTEGAHNRNTVRSGGSSTTLSSTLPAASVSRSASSISTTCQRPVLGRRAAICTISRISLVLILRPSGMTRRTSPWVPAIVVVQAWQWPHPGVPGSVHCSAAAKQRAATDRPEPGGPVNSHECVIAPSTDPARAAIAAAVSSDSTAPWPTNRSKTPATSYTLAAATDRVVGAGRPASAAGERRDRRAHSDHGRYADCHRIPPPPRTSRSPVSRAPRPWTSAATGRPS